MKELAFDPKHVWTVNHKMGDNVVETRTSGNILGERTGRRSVGSNFVITRAVDKIPCSIDKCIEILGDNKNKH